MMLYVAALFYPKAKLWVHGRRNWKAQLAAAISDRGPWIWFHVASLGEFEQGRNLLEAMKTHRPDVHILLTFFSPSGYEVRKNYALASHVAYLPLDHPRTAQAFVEIVQPVFTVFVKYELWLNYLSELRRRQLPAILISASVTPDSKFFTSPLARLYKDAFLAFEAIFTQEEASVKLLRDFSQHPQVISSSDTRYDRVLDTRERFEPLPEIERFVRGRPCLIGGSTWPVGEKLLLDMFEKIGQETDFCMILAPHEISASRIQQGMDRYPHESLTYSQLAELKDAHRILWIDNIGLLSRIYYYGDLAYIGGGFKGGLHNVLEAVAFGCPVSFGPRFANRPEAELLIANGGAVAHETADTFAQWVLDWYKSKPHQARLRATNRRFVEERAGATEQILQYWLSKHN